VITFVREVHHLDFAAAVEWLAGRVGITLRYDNTREGGERRRRTTLVEAMERAVEWYHQRLLTAPDAAGARAYLRARGYDGDTVRAWRLGWAPAGWDGLCSSLRLPVDVLRDTGLGFVNRGGRLQDSFRARVLFPIADARGDAVAIGGRLLPGAEGPKYKNSPSTAIYDKGEVLYGLDRAKGEIVRRGEVVVCEGYTDVIGLTAAGVPHAVATCGTALTERHVASLRNFASRVVLAFDADAAGQGAAERFYEWERRFEVDVAVADLPHGADPADLARQDPEALRHAVGSARPFLAFRLERLLSGRGTSSPEGRARAAESARRIIAEHPNQIVREQYAAQAAMRLDIPVHHLLRGLGRGSAVAPAAVIRPRPRSESAEVLALRLAVQRRDDASEVLHEVLFDDEMHRAAVRALVASPTVHEAVSAAEPEVAELLRRAAVEELDADPEDVVTRLVAAAVERAYRRLHTELRADYTVDGARRADWLRHRIEELRDPSTAGSATDALVPFLVQRAQEAT
jgi:DNA primase